MLGECALSAILYCSSVHHVLDHFALGMAGPAVHATALCTVDYVYVYYFDEGGCSDPECDAWLTPVTWCDLPAPATFASACTFLEEYKQPHLCTSLYDADGDRDIDLADFAALQNDWD